MVDALKQALVQTPGLVGWTLKRRHHRSEQELYRNGPDGLVPHQSRTVIDTALSVDLVRRMGGDGAEVGLGTIDIDPRAPVEPQIALGMEIAAGARNQSWPLPTPPGEPYPNIQTHDGPIHDDPAATLERVRSRVQATVRTEAGVRFNSVEIYVNTAHIETWTSTDIHMVRLSTDIDIDVAVEPLPGPNTQEVHDRVSGLSERDTPIEQVFSRCAEEARALGTTRPPPTGRDIPLLIYAGNLALLFDAVKSALRASRVYHHRTQLELGGPLHTGSVHPDSDLLHLSLDPSRPGMVCSCGATTEGLVATGGPLVEDNIAVDRIVDARYGHYLGAAPNGRDGNTVVRPGHRSIDQLIKPGTLEILNFSSLLVNPHLLTWSSEIKLGRLHTHDGPVWVKGGVVAGNLRENLSHFWLSEETEVVNQPARAMDPSLGYVGPRAALIMAGISVTGHA